MNDAPNPAGQPIDTASITGLVLAGGRGSRMGGVDKGLQNFRGMPLALHALLRLQLQVGAAMVNANRNLGAYDAMGVPVWPDADSEFSGPLAGFLVGLEHCETAWLATVPCDSPNFPADLVERLASAAAQQDVLIAVAATPGEQPGDAPRLEPVFSLLSASLLGSLVQAMAEGERKIERWMRRHPMAVVVFDDHQAFANANTLEELHRLG